MNSEQKETLLSEARFFSEQVARKLFAVIAGTVEELGRPVDDAMLADLIRYARGRIVPEQHLLPEPPGRQSTPFN